MEGVGLLREVFTERTADEWREVLQAFSGQWTIVQTTLEAAEDPQVLANGYIVDCQTAEGTPFKLAAAPVQFGPELPTTNRAPASTSTATRSCRRWVSAWTRSSTSRSAASSPSGPTTLITTTGAVQ